MSFFLAAFFFLTCFPLLNRTATAQKTEWSWALESHRPAQEEEVDALKDHFYLTIARRYFNFRSRDLNLTQVTQLQEIFEEDGEPKVIQASAGTVWDLREVWSLPEASLLIWRATTGSGPVWQFVKGLPLEVLTQVPAEKGDAFTVAQIQDNRLSFNGPIPEALQPYLSVITPIPSREVAWFELMLAEDREDLVDSDARVIELAANPQPDRESAKAAETAHRWVNQPRLPFRAEDLMGKWRVRSLQGSLGLCVLYPYFNAEFRKENGRLIFQKTTGSQRRMGWILPYRNDCMIFLGARTVNDDPPLHYSRLDPTIPATSPRKESDSWGGLYRIGDNQYLMVLDVVPGQKFELYEITSKQP